MKKRTMKLVLSRETVLPLDLVAGGEDDPAGGPPSNSYYCTEWYPCGGGGGGGGAGGTCWGGCFISGTFRP